jgi:hypothetical protein
MYKTTEFDGKLIVETDEGEHFWLGIEELLAAPKEKFSSAEHYALSPLFHEYGKYSEAFVPWSGDRSTWELYFN